VLLRGDPGDQRARLRRVGGGAALRPPAGVQELREELPRHHRRRH